jgi:hypothetical protein
MTAAHAAPDALDRLAAYLAEQLATAGPDTTVHAIAAVLAPYRRVRDVLEVEGAEEYELTLMRLLAGERGYAETSPTTRERLAEELASPNPECSLYRSYLAERVVLRFAPTLPEVTMPVPTARTLTSDDLGGRCRYCSKDLPPGRKLVFCPHCGQNLTTLRCPACSTELELGWMFCVTCGRGLGSATHPGGASG